MNKLFDYSYENIHSLNINKDIKDILQGLIMFLRIRKKNMFI